ncbi:MAG: BTAD domain-containing putative transcriptional regulator [Clostridiaceae bacterium]|nr:BTAD domain-containing putative transcriptional regulator [Clostridiaceae bacterium]
MLSINFLGKPRVEYNGKKLEEQLGSKAIVLICLLILNEKRYMSREKLEGYLWPDSSTDAARYNLRYNLWLIKKNIGPDHNGHQFLHVDSDCCSINKEYEFECDTFDIMSFKHSQNDSLESILKLKQLFRGDLLEGCYFKKCDELNDLIIFERMKYEQRKVKILKGLADYYEKEESFDNCLEVINEILEIEPYDEEMVLKILDIYVKCGKPVVAITYYNNFSKLLTSSLGVSPSNRLRKKYEEIRSPLSDSFGSNNFKANMDTFMKDISKQDYVSDIKIISDCIKNIEYFWIADVIGKIIAALGPDYMNQLSEKELLDLAYIQSDILNYCGDKFELVKDYGRDTMSVCIINAFIKLLRIICSKQEFTIIIPNSIDMDDTSLNVLKYLKRIKIEGLKLIEK